jgi:hypothetical protein
LIGIEIDRAIYKAARYRPNNKMSMQMSGTINGTSEVDLATGLSKKTDMTMNFSGVLKMEPNQDMPEGMTMPMTIKATAVVELTK